MNGSFMALLSALCFAASMICTRRGVVRIKDAALGGYISVFIAPPVYLLMAALWGDLHNMIAFTWMGYVWLAMAGIIHFVFGRFANYWAVKHLGANMASIFVALNPFYTVFLGLFFLGEQISRNMILGCAFIIVGPALLFWPQRTNGQVQPESVIGIPKLSRNGIVAGLLSGLFFGLSPLFVKWGLNEGGSALAGAFVSYVSASALLGATMAGAEKRGALVAMERTALIWFVFSGLFVSLAQLLRYVSFTLVPISVAGPLTATSPMFLILLSFMVNRRLESFRLNVILGALLVVVGTMLVYQI